MAYSPQKKINKFEYVTAFPKIQENFFGEEISRPESPRDTTNRIKIRAPLNSERSNNSDLRSSNYISNYYVSKPVVHNVTNVTQRISINGSIEEKDIYRPDNNRTKSPSPLQT